MTLSTSSSTTRPSWLRRLGRTGLAAAIAGAMTFSMLGVGASAANAEEAIEPLAAPVSTVTPDPDGVVWQTARIKGSDGKYLAVRTNDGAVYPTDNADEASVFNVIKYEYKYQDYVKGTDTIPAETFGSMVTTYAIQDTRSGKYLTIQNYTQKNTVAEKYYNDVPTWGSTVYSIDATADYVSYNERFYLDQNEIDGSYAVSTHMNSERDIKPGDESDGKSFAKYQTKIAGNRFVTFNTEVSTPDKAPYRVSFEKADPQSTIVKDSETRDFTHPGIALAAADLDTMKEHVAKGEQPWKADFDKLVSDPLTTSGPLGQNYTEIGRGSYTSWDAPRRDQFDKDAQTAYNNALAWAVTGDAKYGDKAAETITNWTHLKAFNGRDRILGASIGTYRLLAAAEIVTYYNGGYAGFAKDAQTALKNEMLDVFYPVIRDGSAPMIANGSWDDSSIMTMMAIGIYTENAHIYNRALTMYQDIHVNGSIAAYINDDGVTQEAGRDMDHAQLPIAWMAQICLTAEKQGDTDLWGLYDNRLAKAMNWYAKYNLGHDDVPYEIVDNIYHARGPFAYWDKINTWINVSYRGFLAPTFETALAHYSTVDGVDTTWMEKAARAMRPEGYNTLDFLNYSTLTNYNGKAGEQRTFIQLRTSEKPWYQNTWDEVNKYRPDTNELPSGVDQTLNSFFSVADDGTVSITSRWEGAPVFEVVNNADGTVSLLATQNGKYLSVTDEKADDAGTLVVKASASKIGDNEKFKVSAIGAPGATITSPSHGSRQLTIDPKTSGGPANTSPRLVLGADGVKGSFGLMRQVGDMTVTFNANGGSDVAAQTVEWNDKAAKPADPTRDGYTFTGWYSDEALTHAWDFDADAVTGNVTLYAGWTKQVAGVDKAGLIAAITDAEGVDGNGQGDYTDASWKAFQTALGGARQVRDDENATQEQVDAATAALKTAKDGLKHKDNGGNGNGSNGSENGGSDGNGSGNDGNGNNDGNAGNAGANGSNGSNGANGSGSTNGGSNANGTVNGSNANRNVSGAKASVSRLSRTGSAVAGIAIAAIALVGAGAALVLRKRRA
ncbi:InlB B-repeat-containing protein [Bifidobacterium vansinderenii]|uniref:Listeria-Bacteroides repeat domain n=1 Tax=Bifidobacterium vansinderenii TaxID=1984871 RepID=A0A229VYY1_9BIFI|nr:InlB B-repeat-containing protein [Bifidobacterium vansinderenii]OXN00833.1 Listeria-Bacteroides repeat domain [Bifidobacterium vansinderenii]